MINKKLTLSVIIPTYNEERHIKDCLDSIAKQSRMPEEVILVDNNSSDDTVAIAKKYKFVRVIKEKKQGLIHARNAGFRAAKGDILGRIDADSILIEDWTQAVLSELEQNQQYAAVTGPGYFPALRTFNNEHTIFWTKLYNLGALGYFRFQVLWGANMAIRSKVWGELLPHTALRDSNVHEDQDISGVLNMFGYKVKYADSMRIYSDVHRYWDPSKLCHYYVKTLKTVRRMRLLRKKLGKVRHPEISFLRAVIYSILTIPFIMFFGTMSLFKK